MGRRRKEKKNIRGGTKIRRGKEEIRIVRKEAQKFDQFR